MKNRGTVFKFILLFIGIALISAGIVFLNLEIAIGAIISITLGVSCLAICLIIALLIKKSL